MNGIGFKNMKVFKDEHWFDFKNITILTGTNNSGKSSIINAMQMLQENLKGSSIDDLVRTQFILRANQNKYGSIETFINNESKKENNYFVFIRRIGNTEYKVKVKVIIGIESRGEVEKIIAFDVPTGEFLFALEVHNQYPHYQFAFNINYSFFVNRFYEKCRNTEKFFKCESDLLKMVEKVNQGEIQLEEIEQYAADISKEFLLSIDFTNEYLDLTEEKWSSPEFQASNNISSDNILNDSSPFEKEPDLDGIPDKKPYITTILRDNFESTPSAEDIDKEVIFFTKKKSDFGSAEGFVITESVYNSLYRNSFNDGIFDFSSLWEKFSEKKLDFEIMVSNYYQKDFESSCKLLTNDLLTVLSNEIWQMKENYSELFGEEFVPLNLTATYINSLPYFGLIPSPQANVYAGKSPLQGSEGIKQLEKSGFFDDIYTRINEFFQEVTNNKNVNLKQLNLIPEPVFNEIFSEISRRLLDVNLCVNTDFISSSRFVAKRTHSFNDHSDFTKQLEQLDKMDNETKLKANEFIDHWIKEYKIADKLSFKPDPETGNFKAYLTVKGNEMLLSDYGLGTNQLLPIIFALGIHSYHATMYSNEIVPRTVVIEEPEANLHPALQSKLADMFVDATKKFGVQIIVETHSEYLIRKMQYLVASKQSEAKSEDVVIYYFYKPDHPAVISGEVKQVERIDIDESGILSKDFGSGFFDEALHWKFELLKLKNMN